jgi:hypothetical protein
MYGAGYYGGWGKSLLPGYQAPPSNVD